ncbi:hypothetical protein JR316_0012640 [Psilocybe cubensis]|nr:hypothetical protein JR316_0012640 [Psilocybe cubensis]KAH9475525.1 hypothetical protein JR316_0012640 [Psilocybe cubensis]
MVRRLSIPRIASSSRKLNATATNTRSTASVPISSSGRAARSRRHPYHNYARKQKQPVGGSKLYDEIDVENGSPSPSVSESGTQQHLQSGVVDITHVGVPLEGNTPGETPLSPSKDPELFDFRGLTCFPEENIVGGNPIPSPLYPWNMGPMAQYPPQPCNSSYISTYLPFIPPPVDLYPGPMYHEYGGPYYQPPLPYPAQVQQVQVQESFENIDPVLRPPMAEQFQEIQGPAPPQYSEAVPNNFYTYPVNLPTANLEEKVATAKANITDKNPYVFIVKTPVDEGAYPFIVETPNDHKPRARKERQVKNLGFRQQAGTRVEVGKVPGKVISAAWLSKAIAWKKNGSAKKNRKLVETVHFDEPCVYEEAPVHVKKEDLPEIPCPMAGCDELLRGREELFNHLKDPTGPHKIVVNNSVGQTKVPCRAEDPCNVHVISGGMARHLVEGHSSVWFYCTTCNKCLIREDQMKEHFKKAHPGQRLPTKFREVLHRPYEEDSE